MSYSITWNADADGDWGSASNWNPANLPGGTDDVGIDTADLHTVTYSTGSSSINSLFVGNDNFVLSGGSLSIGTGATFSNALSISGGSLSLGGNSEVDGVFTNTGIVSLTSGIFDLKAGGSSDVSGFALSAGSILEFDGDWYGQSHPAFTLNGGGTLGSAGSAILVDGAWLDFSADTTIAGNFWVTSGTLDLGSHDLTIDGSFEREDGAGVLVEVDGTGKFTTLGEADIFVAYMGGSGTTQFEGTTTFDGEFFAYGGRLVKNLGIMIIHNETNLELDYGGISNVPGSLVNGSSGVIKLDNGQIINFSAEATFLNKGTVESNSPVSGNSNIGAGISLNNEGSIVVQSGTLNIGGAPYQLPDAYPVFHNGGTVEVQSGTLNIFDATVNGHGTITVDGGASLSLDESATGLDSMIVVAGSGSADLTGGSGNDIFRFEGSFPAGDVVDGGAGIDRLTLNGDYTSGLTLDSSVVQNVEHLRLLPGHSYAVTAADSLQSAGDTFKVNASMLGAGDHLVFDGSAETDGHFTILLGSGGATITSGQQADTITAGAGADTFVYDSAAQSTSAVRDTIKNVDFAIDRFDVPRAITSVADSAHTAISSATFDSDIADATSGLLGRHTAVYVTADGGGLSGRTYLVVDMNGVAGYQAGADLVIHLSHSTGTLSTADFI